LASPDSGSTICGPWFKSFNRLSVAAYSLLSICLLLVRGFEGSDDCLDRLPLLFLTAGARFTVFDGGRVLMRFIALHDVRGLRTAVTSRTMEYCHYVRMKEGFDCLIFSSSLPSTHIFTRAEVHKGRTCYLLAKPHF